MEKKHLKIEIPEGYEIDKENSTFENIVFKPIKTTVIRRIEGAITGVEVYCDGEHFIIPEMKYRFAMPWNDAMEYAKDNQCKLPSKKMLQIMYTHKKDINRLLKQSKLEEDRWYWTNESAYDGSGAWYVYFLTGSVYRGAKSLTGYVRFIINCNY